MTSLTRWLATKGTVKAVHQSLEVRALSACAGLAEQMVDVGPVLGRIRVVVSVELPVDTGSGQASLGAPRQHRGVNGAKLVVGSVVHRMRGAAARCARTHHSISLHEGRGDLEEESVEVG